MVMGRCRPPDGQSGSPVRRNSQLADRAQLAGGFEPFGDDRCAPALGEVAQRAQHGPRGVALGALLDERQVDLDDVEADLAQQPQAGIARANVVGGDTDPGAL